MQWFVRIEGKQYGPYMPAALKQLAANRRLTPQSMVRSETDQHWLPAGNINGLFPAPTQNPAPIMPVARKLNQTPSRPIAAQQTADPLDFLTEEPALTPPSQASEAGDWLSELSGSAPAAPARAVPVVRPVATSLQCPHCQNQITVDGSLAGQTLSCPHCSGVFLAPMPTAQAVNPPYRQSNYLGGGGGFLQRQSGDAIVNQTLGIIGAIILLLSFFCPIISFFGMNASYFDLFRNAFKDGVSLGAAEIMTLLSGVLVLGLAVASLVLAALRRFPLLWFTGGGAAIPILITFVSLSDAPKGIGLAVTALGGGLIVAGAAVPIKQTLSQPRSRFQ